MKHEKWFWEHCDAHNDDIKRQLLRVKNSTDVIACVEFIHGDTAEHKANAHRIAATPDLLAACQNFQEWWANHFEDFDKEVNGQLLCLSNDFEEVIATAKPPE